MARLLHSALLALLLLSSTPKLLAALASLPCHNHPHSAFVHYPAFLPLPLCRPTFEDIVQQLEDMAGQLEELKQQQAQAMAAAAAPVYQPGTTHHDPAELAHELTPSMMRDLMPSGFSAGSEHSGDEVQIADSGTLYEMSQLSSGSHEKDAQGVQDLQHHQQQQ